MCCYSKEYTFLTFFFFFNNPDFSKYPPFTFLFTPVCYSAQAQCYIQTPLYSSLTGIHHVEEVLIPNMDLMTSQFLFGRTGKPRPLWHSSCSIPASVKRHPCASSVGTFCLSWKTETIYLFHNQDRLLTQHENLI